jgi:hypothetical protein
MHNEPVSVAAVRVDNPDRVPIGIDGCYATPTPSGLAEIVSNELPVIRGLRSHRR